MKPFPSQTQLPEYGAAAFIFVGRRLSKILQLQKYNTPPNPMNSHRVRSTAHGVLRPYTDRPLCLQTRKDLKFDAPPTFSVLSVPGGFASQEPRADKSGKGEAAKKFASPGGCVAQGGCLAR